MKQDKLKATARLLEIMDTLREQCPWDRKQTSETLRNNTIEETYELADAILNKDLDGIKEEAGDLLLHVVFYAKLVEEAGVVVERPRHREWIVIARQAQGTAHILMVRVQIGDEVAAFLVTEEAQTSFEHRGLAHPLRHDGGDRKVAPSHLLLCRPRRPPLRARGAGKNGQLTRNLPDVW